MPRQLTRTIRSLVVLMVVLLAPITGHGKERVALVIGNNAYPGKAELDNPVADATAMTAALERLGFRVIGGNDVTRVRFEGLIRDFAKALPGAEIALFFYAGHGMQVGGKNYLLPIDAALQAESDLDFETINMDLVLRQMDRHPAAKIVLLDACRNNPFEEALTRSMNRTRAANLMGRGLAEMKVEGGVLIGFATDPGAVAYDGVGNHSPFTGALLQHIETPGIEINTMLTRVRSEVYDATSRKQRPWASSSLLGELYLAGVPGETEPEDEKPRVDQRPPANDQTTAAFELAFWDTVKNSQRREDYEAYLKQYPQGVFADLARNRIKAVEAPKDRKEVIGTPRDLDEDESAPRKDARLLARAESAPFLVQLIASANRNRPAALLRQLEQRHRDLFRDHAGFIQAINMSGTEVYRLRLGPFFTRGEAEDMCLTLRGRGVDCVVAINR